MSAHQCHTFTLTGAQSVSRSHGAEAVYGLRINDSLSHILNWVKRRLTLLGAPKSSVDYVACYLAVCKVYKSD